MLEGYEKFRLSNKISPNTVIHETRMLHSMLVFINQKYNKNLEPHEIRPIDIREYLDHERSTGIKDSTVNRKLVFIRQWFDYMWQIGKIQLDFMPKFKYAEKLDLAPSPININYQYLLQIKSQLLKDQQLNLIAKQLFIFYMRGLRVRDIIQISINNFTDDGDKLTLKVEKQSGIIVEFDFIDADEIAVLLAGIERAIFRNVSFLFSSKVKGEYGIFQLGSIKSYLKSLSEYIGLPFRSEEVRFAYVHYLYNVKNLKIEDLQDELGTSIGTTTRILKESLERLGQVDYNVKRTDNRVVN
ncbi:recombinase XerC [Sporosarcina sp. FSL K6-1508]|uniref:recombinase XerC n=1 Tax=Sporosarcina sp. FSL K6-1508 TaxID=2921553 RepID=UPI0030F5A510